MSAGEKLGLTGNIGAIHAYRVLEIAAAFGLLFDMKKAKKYLELLGVDSSRIPVEEPEEVDGVPVNDNSQSLKDPRAAALFKKAIGRHEYSK